MTASKLRIAILGSGPTGLEAALAAADAGYAFTIYEAAAQAASHVRDWGHVRLFTSWDLNVSARMRQALDEAGESVPEGTEYPTGAELVEKVLDPVSAVSAISGHINTGFA